MTRINHAFTGLARDAAGMAHARLTDESGTGVGMSWDSTCAWVQLYTADLPDGSDTRGHREGVAVEPMTCAPDAFNHDSYAWDSGLIVLEPGDESSASWRISAGRPKS